MNKRRAQYAAAAGVALATLAVYLPALWNGFLAWDDDHYVVENVHIRSMNGAFFRWAFGAFHSANWHPLTWISHALDYAFWGLDPLGHHLTNIVLHGLNTFLVVLLASKLLTVYRERTGASFPGEEGTLIAAGVTGLLFGIHPLHVESVAWVSERKDLLCALFYLSSVLAYLDHAGRPQGAGSPLLRRLSILSLGFFSLALLSKPMAVSLPVVLLILDWHPLGRITSREELRSAVIGKLPFVALAAASAVVTVLAQRAGGAIVPVEIFPFGTRLLIAFQAIVSYLGKMVWPETLLPYYGYPRSVSLFDPGYLVPVLLVAAAVAWRVMAARKHPLWAAAGSYYLITLLPVLGLVQVGNQSMADRYTYLPSLGPFLLAGLGASWVWKRTAGRATVRRMARWSAVVLGVAVSVTLAYRTIGQIGVWKDSIGFWNYILEKDPGAGAIPYNNRGELYYKMGRYDLAVQDLSAAVVLSPEDPSFYNNRGVAWEGLGRQAEALADYDKAVELSGSDVKGHYNRGILLFKMGRAGQALEDFNAAIALDPADATYYNNRGIVLDSMGRTSLALADFDRAIVLDPGHVTAYLNRGGLHLRSGRRQLALTDYEQACDLGNAEGCEAARRVRERRK